MQKGYTWEDMERYLRDEGKTESIIKLAEEITDEAQDRDWETFPNLS